MSEILFKIIPIILIFILGYFLKRIKILKKEDGDLFLKLVFYVAMPSLIINSISKINLSLELLLLPIIAMLIVFATSVISFGVGKIVGLSRATFGAFLVGTTIMNVGFTLPFVISAFGEEGLACMSLFDFGGGLLTYTLIYYFACKFGENTGDEKAMIKKFLVSPPLWALLIAVVINFLGYGIPAVAFIFFQLLGGLTVPLVMLSMGIYFDPKLSNVNLVLSAVFIRMVVGLFLGVIFTTLFNLEGLSRTIVLIGASAPVGYTSLTYASLENLDKEFASSLISVSVLLGIVLIPILLILF